ncbi:hypothetical protein BT69DRAFT_1284250 [Atractiella rhizophila]|nr:hypothetical protein BT69DRAFT_1284250 [Atractiella rhizophila]
MQSLVSSYAYSDEEAEQSTSTSTCPPPRNPPQSQRSLGKEREKFGVTTKSKRARNAKEVEEDEEGKFRRLSLERKERHDVRSLYQWNRRENQEWVSCRYSPFDSID